MTDNKKIQEIQFLEQNLQNIVFQKQAFQMELSETQASLNELENSNEEVFKIIGQMMVKTEKSKIKDELKEKEKLIQLRVSTLEKQEEKFAEKLENLRKEIIPNK